MDNELLALLNGSGTTVNKPDVPTPATNTGTQSDGFIKAITERLTKQGQGISSSSSSNLKSEIEKAIIGTEQAGEMTRERLLSEKGREVSFARGQASDTYNEALEGRKGYGTQVSALRKLTETTEKSVRDLDQRYQEAILANDAATAKTISDLRIKKLEFQQQQEESFYSNLFALGNLQEQALNRAQQNEQFWIKKEQDDKQFVIELTNSKYEFEKTMGLQLQELSLKEQQLDIDRSRLNLSYQEYRDKKNELTKEKSFTNTKAIIAQDIKNKIAEGIDTNLFLTPDYLQTVGEKTGFDGTTEELSTIIKDAFASVSKATSGVGKIPYTTNRELNKTIQAGNNIRQVIKDRDNGTIIQSPESYWASLFK